MPEACEPKPFAEQVLDHQDDLRRYSHYLTRSMDDMTDDLLQATWERALDRQHRFAQDTDMRAWLFAIMRHLFVDHVRRASRYTITDPILFIAAANGYRKGQKVMGKERLVAAIAHNMRHAQPDQIDRVQLNEMAGFIAELTPEKRHALLGVVMYERGYPELAAEQDCAVGTIRSRIYRAREELHARCDGAEAA